MYLVTVRHSERGKKTRQTEEEVGRQHQEMDRPGLRQVPEGSGEEGKMEKTGCKIICGAPTTLAVKGLMMMMNNFLVEPYAVMFDCFCDVWCSRYWYLMTVNLGVMKFGKPVLV